MNIIKNENVETFSYIFKYLKTNYNFVPISINVDYSKAEIISIKKIFPNTKIILCYYHIIIHVIKHIPELRCKDKLKKKKAMDLLANIKILLYLNKNKVKYFFDMIIKHYEKEFSSFIKYFYMNYKGVCKSVKNFEDAINSLIDIYKNKKKYIEGKFSIMRAIALYIRTENVNKLIDNDTMQIIAKNYYKGK